MFPFMLNDKSGTIFIKQGLAKCGDEKVIRHGDNMEIKIGNTMDIIYIYSGDKSVRININIKW